ncbi:hypothetical protein D3C76_1442650 [compost metagenome]
MIAHAGVDELTEDIHRLRRLEARGVLAVEAVGVVQPVGDAELGRQLVVVEVGRVAVDRVAVEVLRRRVRLELVVVVAQAR